MGYRALRDDERVFLPHPSGLRPATFPVGEGCLRRGTKLPFAAVEEQGQHAGAYVGAGEGLVGDDEDVLGGGDGSDLFGQELGIGQAVPVGDGHQVVGGIHLLLGVGLYQGVDGLLPAPDLAAGYDVAVGAAVEDGLDVQHRADGRR